MKIVFTGTEGQTRFKMTELKSDTYFMRYEVRDNHNDYLKNGVNSKTIDAYVYSVLSTMKNKEKYIFAINAFYPALFSQRIGRFDTYDKVFAMADYIQDSFGVQEANISWFDIFIRKKPIATGGSDINKNDCLYNCISQALGGKEYMPRTLKKRSDFKKHMGVERNDKIPISKMNILEDILNVSITVIGDYQYLPKIARARNINIKLHNGHYSLLCNTNRSSTKLVNFKPLEKSKVISYIYDFDMVIVYDGDSEVVMTRENFNKKYKKFDYLRLIVKAKKDLIQRRNEFIKHSDDLLMYSNGFINHYRSHVTGYLAMDVWRQMSKSISEPEELDIIEHMVCDIANRGGFHFLGNPKQYKNKVYDYDVNSMYPYYMSSKSFMFPVKKGVQSILTNDDIEEMNTKNFIRYGLYRCRLHGKNYLLRNSKFENLEDQKYSWYTHYALTMYKRMGLKIDLCFDGHINHISYDSKSRITGEKVFKPYVDYMYNLRLEGADTKPFLNSLWGVLCSKNTKKVYVSGDDCIYVGDHFLNYVEHVNDNIDIIEMTDAVNVFKFPYARLGCFLTSYCQMKIIETIYNNVNNVQNVVYVNCDGFVALEEVKSLSISKKLGDWKLKTYDHCNITKTKINFD